MCVDLKNQIQGDVRFRTCSDVENEQRGQTALVVSVENHSNHGGVLHFASVAVTKGRQEQYRAVGMSKEVWRPNFELRYCQPIPLQSQHATTRFCFVRNDALVALEEYTL